MNTNSEEEKFALAGLLHIGKTIVKLGRSTTFEDIKSHMECIASDILEVESLILTDPTLKAHPPSWHLSQTKDTFIKILEEDTDLLNMPTPTLDETNKEATINEILTIATAWDKRILSDNLLSDLHERFLSFAIAWTGYIITLDSSTADVYPHLQHSSRSSSEEDISISTNTSRDSTKNTTAVFQT
jgi:hypothetical protein